MKVSATPPRSFSTIWDPRGNERVDQALGKAQDTEAFDGGVKNCLR